MGERQRLVKPEEMATTSTAVATVPPQLQEEPVERVAVITLRPTATRASSRKKVGWSEDTVDNENMNKKKSKCCCIYEKPRKFDESESETSDDECEHCFGHVEKRGKRHHTHEHQHQHQPQPQTVTVNQDQETVQPEPTATVTLQPAEAGPAPPEPGPAPPDKAPAST